jgi:hypothetical protein
LAFRWAMERRATSQSTMEVAPSSRQDWFCRSGHHVQQLAVGDRGEAMQLIDGVGLFGGRGITQCPSVHEYQVYGGV